MRAFDRLLSVSAEDIEFELRGFACIPWADFVLNPRRLRGSDFLMRWSQGVWSEHRLIQAVNETGAGWRLDHTQVRTRVPVEAYKAIDELRISEQNLDLAWHPPYTGAA